MYFAKYNIFLRFCSYRLCSFLAKEIRLIKIYLSYYILNHIHLDVKNFQISYKEIEKKLKKKDRTKFNYIKWKIYLHKIIHMYIHISNEYFFIF